MMKRYSLQPGNELRGFKIRLYPDKVTEERLANYQKQLKPIWNWMVKMNHDHKKAVEAYAVREGLVGPRPSRPSYDKLEPDAAAELAESFRTKNNDWYAEVDAQTRDIECCQRREVPELLEHFQVKDAYRLFGVALSWYREDPVLGSTIKVNAHMLDAMAKNFFSKSARPKKYKKHYTDMPLQVRSGRCFEIGEFGPRGSNPNYYNCQIILGQCRIRGRLPGARKVGALKVAVSPSGRVL